MDERDSIEKLRLGTVIGPILAYFFRNTPYLRRDEPMTLLRISGMWDYLDFQRAICCPVCSMIALWLGGLRHRRAVHAAYMFASLTHTLKLWLPGASPRELHRPAFRERGENRHRTQPITRSNHHLHAGSARLKLYPSMRTGNFAPVNVPKRRQRYISFCSTYLKHREHPETSSSIA